MAKKIIVICITMAVCGAALFAQEEPAEQESVINTQTKDSRNLEIGAGYHGVTETQTVDGTEIKTTIPSVAINFASKRFFTEKVVFAMYVNFLLPQELQ